MTVKFIESPMPDWRIFMPKLSPVDKYKFALKSERSQLLRAIVSLVMGAQENHAPSMYRLGYMCLHGHGSIRKNQFTNEGIWFYKKASQLNHPTAAYDLAVFYERAKSEEAIFWYKEAAKTNLSALSYFRLGQIFQGGILEIEKNTELAAEYYQKAHEQYSDCSKAAYFLGLFAKSKGYNYVAGYWFSFAAREGYLSAFQKCIDSFAYDDLNPLVLRAYGQFAIQCLEKLYESDYAVGSIKQQIAIQLGSLYFCMPSVGIPGTQLEVYWDKSADWYEIALTFSPLGEDIKLKKRVYTDLGVIYTFNNDIEFAEEYLQIAIELKDPRAMYQLGSIYLELEENDEDLTRKEKAFDLLLQSQALGHSDAQEILVQKFGINYPVINFTKSICITASKGCPFALITCIQLIKNFRNDFAMQHLNLIFESSHVDNLIKQQMALELGEVFYYKKKEQIDRFYWPQADICYKKAIALGFLGKDIEKIVYSRLGNIALYQNNYEEAEKYLLKAVHLGDIEAGTLLGWLYYLDSEDADPDMVIIKKQTAFDIWTASKESGSLAAEALLQYYFNGIRPSYPETI